MHADSDGHQLKIISMGCTVFVRNQGKNSANVECIYRVCQDGIRFLLPWLTNRIIYTDCTDTFKRLIMHSSSPFTAHSSNSWSPVRLGIARPLADIYIITPLKIINICFHLYMCFFQENI